MKFNLHKYDEKRIEKLLADLWTNHSVEEGKSVDKLQEDIENVRDRMIAICEPILQPQTTKKP
jgi:hypothetical protein